VNPRTLVAGLVLLLVLVGAACGSSDSSASRVESDRRTPARSKDGATGHAAAAVSQQGATQVIRYGGVGFVVPADWPVYDLEADPTTCVRFDVNAVYLGHPGDDMRCPAGILGRAGAVLVEPLDGTSAPTPLQAASSAVNDVPLEIDAAAAVENQIRAALPAQGLSVTVAFAGAEADAQQILDSFKVATP
jgi:hypothetical protein